VPKFELVGDVFEESRCLCRDTRGRSIVRGAMKSNAGAICDVSDITTTGMMVTTIVYFAEGPSAHYRAINSEVVMWMTRRAIVKTGLKKVGDRNVATCDSR
jgi:hypothetical protein